MKLDIEKWTVASLDVSKTCTKKMAMLPHITMNRVRDFVQIKTRDTSEVLLYSYPPAKDPLVKTIIIGVDIGKQGGLVAIDYNASLVARAPMPLYNGAFDLETTTRVLRYIKEYYKNHKLHMVVEKAMQYSKGKLGLQSLGYCEGAFHTWASAFKFELLTVKPTEWQKVILGKTKDTKEASKDWVLERYKDFSWTKNRGSHKIHDGLTDACCIANYGLRRIFSQEI